MTLKVTQNSTVSTFPWFGFRTARTATPREFR